MLENCQSAKERWGGVSNIVDQWLLERQQLLVKYCELSKCSNFDESDNQQCDDISTLCQLLVDYVSAGHFEVYNQLIKEGQEFGDEDALKTASKLFDTIDHTTEYALDFNDKYLATDDLSSLPKDLSKLGEELATRFEAEDEMIAVLHVAHKDLVA